MAKVAKKGGVDPKSMVMVEVDPTECPFREFRDSELGQEYWGLGPAAFRAAFMQAAAKTGPKPTASSSASIWVDDQTQPLPRSVRQYLNGWVRAEELAINRWEAEVVVFEDTINGGRMGVADIQLSHTQVLTRSAFCRRVLSACYMLERVDVLVEHQWENFVLTFGPEGWRARYYIYSPGTKAGGGAQHRPGLSKNGCYLVRLYYLGAWRCVWVSDQVPVDATDAPLLPFSPLLTHPPKALLGKNAPATVKAHVVHLWPLLLCKALLKLATPDMNVDGKGDRVEEDEVMSDFDIMHALTGAVSLVYFIDNATLRNELWRMITTEVPMFSWDDDNETVTSTVKSKSTKKPSNKEATVVKSSMVMVMIADTREQAPYYLPGITPTLEMNLIVSMARDVPLKRPLPEPDVALWKHLRWVDWARRHGLYEAYDCPRTQFLKVNGLMKLFYAPHLLDLQSTESMKKGAKELGKSVTNAVSEVGQKKDELREWVEFEPVKELIKSMNILFFPSMFEYTSVCSNPPTRITKAAPNRAVDIPAPKAAPLYLQLDGPEENTLRLSLSMLHPRILSNSGVPIVDYIEKAYIVLEMFEWFVDSEILMAKAYIQTRGYDTVEVKFKPGRHFCRLWVHSRMSWSVAMISESTLLLGSRDLLLAAAVRECPWAAKFLSYLGSAFANWIRVSRSNTNIILFDREFYSSYQPDMEWDPEIVGYDKAFRHWMFRQALQSLLYKRLLPAEFAAVCAALRRYLCDPEFGLPARPRPPRSLREVVARDPCDCLMPEPEEPGEAVEEQIDEQLVVESEERPLVNPRVMKQLLRAPAEPATSQVCELATEELPCGVLKDERAKLVRRHEAAILLQAHWRGVWARRCLRSHVTFSADLIKFVMENAFGNLEALSALMNEFFGMYPGAKTAYSVSSALSGVYGIQQHHGISPMTPICRWIPYFQGVFYCHAPVKVHFDVQSNVQHSTVAVYNNDNGEQMPQAYNAHITFEFTPNDYGYTVMGHGTLNQPAGVHAEVHWQLTVLSSVDNVFHVCDNPDTELCSILPLQAASKLHLDEIYMPNRRNILGGVTISVTRIEAVSFRAAATCSDLEIEAVLRTTSEEGEVQELARCHGNGEICWPYIRLKPTNPLSIYRKRSVSQAVLPVTVKESQQQFTTRSQKGSKQKPQSAGSKSRSQTKLKDNRPAPAEPKQYTIQVIAPNGWPLPLAQWRRVDEVRNSLEAPKVEVPVKKSGKEKGATAKESKKEDKEKEREKTSLFTVHQPLPDDAYVELECSTTIAGGAYARRDNERDLLFASARRQWDAKEPGRNARGAQIRNEFRAEFLALPTPPPVLVAKSESEFEAFLEASISE